MASDAAEFFAGFFPDKKLQPYLKLLFEKLTEGSICIEADNAASADMLASNLVATSITENKPFVLHNGLLYMQRFYQYETLLLKNLKGIIANEATGFNERLKFLQEQSAFFIKNFPIESGETNWQAVAAIVAFLNNFTIITGGPGTGKTTTVAKILLLLLIEKPNASIALAAPTGKAAARMAESLRNSFLQVSNDAKDKLQQLVPTTIHRLLGYKKNSIYFKHNEANKLNADIIIIDESSMLDIALFSKLLNAVGNNTRIIFLGDKDQLTSVEAGSIFGDMCSSLEIEDSFNEEYISGINSIINNNLKLSPLPLKTNTNILTNHIVHLQKSFRFSAHSGIGSLARVVLQNDIDKLGAFFENKVKDISFDNHYSTNFVEKFCEGYLLYINEPDTKEAIKKLDKLRFLCAIKTGDKGLHATNKFVEQFLSSKGKLTTNGIFYENRPIMLTKNYPDFGVFNGEVGIVRKAADGNLYAFFLTATGELKQLLPGYLQEAETAFAMTIHKSQGTEFDEVLIRLPENTTAKILSRELIYTAITRAKQSVFIQATKDTFVKAMQASVERASGIAKRLSMM